MPPRPLQIGPAGRAVAHAIEHSRTARGYSLRQLAARVTALGRPMSFTALSRVERTIRRCDVDDLVAIAAALEIPPHFLLAEPRVPSERAQHSRRSPVTQTGDPLDH
ncbi:helix-turn-helix transcriptional regulator [Streptomyces xanthochromogenes]|nr:helix-turn-helix transcriptional regulator [Streptomyces xanthochromogenes]